MEIETRKGYAIWAEIYDSEKNPLVAVEEPVVERILQAIPHSTVLDAGAGTGRYALRLARYGASVSAIDECPQMLDVARNAAAKEGLHLDFHIGSIEQHLPFEAGKFDLVICSLVLTHVPDIKNPLSEFHRVSSQDGYLLITDFHPDIIAQDGRTVFCSGEKRYQLPNMKHTRVDYLNAVGKSGFDLLEVVDIPIRNVPKGYLPEKIIRDHGNVNFCLVILARKHVFKTGDKNR